MPFTLGSRSTPGGRLPLSSDKVATRGTTNPGAGRLAWLIVALLWPVGLLNYMDRLLITSMHDAIENSLPMTETQFGLLTSVFLWVYGAACPFAGFLADRFGRRRMIIGSLLVWSIFTWLTGRAHSYETLFLSRAGMGISEACYLPAALALICDYHRGRTQSLATGLQGTGLYVGTALGGIGGYMAQYWDWRVGFVAFGAVGIAYAVLLARFLPDSPGFATSRESIAMPQLKPSEIRFGSALAALARQPGFWVLGAGLVLLGICMWLIYGWLPTYLHEHFHLGLGVAGLSATGYTQIAVVVGLLVGGRWADRWVGANPRGRIFVAAWGGIVAAPALFFMAEADTFGVAIGALLLFGLGIGFYSANTMPILRQVADARYSATGFGILASVSCIAGGLMNYAGGAFRDRHVDLAVVFQGSAAGVLVAGLLLLAIRPRTPSLIFADS